MHDGELLSLLDNGQMREKSLLVQVVINQGQILSKVRLILLAQLGELFEHRRIRMRVLFQIVLDFVLDVLDMLGRVSGMFQMARGHGITNSWQCGSNALPAINVSKRNGPNINPPLCQNCGTPETAIDRSSSCAQARTKAHRLTEREHARDSRGKNVANDAFTGERL
jgi:hypothetical protein